MDGYRNLWNGIKLEFWNHIVRTQCIIIIIIIIIYYVRRQHNITSPLQKTVEKHKKLKSKIHNNKANHTANEIVVHASVHNSFLN